MSEKILIIGSCGQIGTELTIKLRELYGKDNVVAADINSGSNELMYSGPFEILDATKKDDVKKILKKYKITDVYLMAAMLSAVGEKFPEKAWNLNMNSLLIVLDLAKDGFIKKVFWPSSMAAFGPTSPKIDTPQMTIMEPSTVYGISKLAGERWCEYYHQKFGVDVRSIRYPGIISWKTKPGGGTTDYAIDIFYKAVSHENYTCFLSENTRLPMMYMEDAIKATVDIMQADSSKIKVRSSYNLSAIDFTPAEVYEEIKKHYPDFKVTYAPDFRQAIADSWPQRIDDSVARKDWGWNHSFDLKKMSDDMIKNLAN
ncbi:MAG: NAD-dependent epimerase/dehydratase family protein [Flavobacteriaceae bacterium]|nr:NAD-dependent epimerase/dehydratase family protein [Flavobacteriaceae bacterium]